MRLEHQTLRVAYRSGRFAIAGHSGSHATTILVRVTDDALPGLVGYGEAVPSERVMGKGHDAVIARLDAAAASLRDVSLDPDDTAPAVPEGAGAKGPAACAVDGALLDLWARAREQPLWRALGLRTDTRPTSATVSLGDADAMAQEARTFHAAGFTHLKVKLGETPHRDKTRIAAVHEAVPNAVLRVDGNEGWSLQDALAMVPTLAASGIDLLEQPLPRDAPTADHHALNEALEPHRIPHVLDEAVHTMEDAERIGRDRLAHGVNLKLQKAGGLRPGLRLLDAADRHDLKVLIGCFIETWAGIALAAQPAARAQWLDLDGAWLLADEPVLPSPPILRDGSIGPSAAPGLGISTGESHTRPPRGMA